jgi:RHS repeat-associated protein
MRIINSWSAACGIGAVLALTAFSQDSTSTTTPVDSIGSIDTSATSMPSGSTGPSPLPLIDPNIQGSVGIWRPIIRDWHSTDWQMTQMVTNSATGHLQPQVARQFTEVGGGINYISDLTGAWERSSCNIDLMTNSAGAAAAHGPTKVFFSPTLGLNGPTIRMISCSNVVLQIQPASIYYVDESGHSALLANLRPDAEGELVPPNRVLYRSVTTNGVAADLIFTYTPGAFESDLLILSQPSKTPDMMGVDPATARISLVHSVKGVMPNIAAATIIQEGLEDSRMDFSGISFPQGYAFSTWDSSDTNNFPEPGIPAQVNAPAGPWDGGRIPVAKRIIPIGFQQWGLVEDVRWADIKPKLEALPAYTQGGSASTPTRRASLDQRTPGTKTAKPKPGMKLMKVASAAYRPKAVDLDFISIVTGGAYTFASGQTYFLAAPVSFAGTVNLYGSCVIKETNGASLTLNGPVNCYGTAANPSIITSFNDWAVGEDSLPGSTGYPSVLNQTALKVALTNSATTLSGLKIRFAQTALEVDGNPALTSYLTYSSLEWCSNGLYVGNCTVNVSGSYRCNVTTQTNGTGSYNIVGSFQDECGGSDNGLSQSWEFEYFAQGGISASADPDSDGLSNLTEYSDGTNPNVYDGPKIAAQPQTQTVVVGNNASFSVGATGTGTLSYQWYRAGVPISGATASTYSISNVQLTNSTYYFALVTNLYGAVSSASAFLSVAIPTNGVPAPSGITAWWPGNGNDNDGVGTNNGTIGNSWVSAEVGQGFNVQNSSSVVRISSAPALNIGVNSGFTVEGWIDPYDSVSRPVIEWAPTNSYGVHVWVNFQSVGAVWVNIADTAGNSHIFQSAASLISANTFQHLAVTYDKTTGYLQLLTNGTLVTNYSIGIFPPQTSADLWLGCRPSTVNGTGANFNGKIDEMSLYNRVLGTNEIAAIFNAGSNGKFITTPPTITAQPYWPGGSAIPIGTTTNITVTATGTAPLSYQWMFNGNAIAGATASSYTITNIQQTNQGVYSVVVANIAGSALSSSGTGFLLVNNYCIGLLGLGIIDWWRAEQNANDQVGTNNGQWVGTANYASGQIGQAFSFSGTVSNYVSIPNSATLQLTNAFTIEFWCKDTGLGNGAYGGLFAKRPYTGACNYGLTLIGGTTMDTLLVYLLDPNYNGGNYQSMSCANFPHDGAFHHIAVTYNQNNSTQIGVQAFVDGASVGTATFSGNLANTLNTAPATIGASNYSGDWFKGLIDELSVYSGVLTGTEIAQIAESPVPGKCYNPPIFVLQPQSQSVLQGSTPMIGAVASGDVPLAYTWYFNGSVIPGIAPNQTAIWLTNVQPANAGDYWSVASNIVGTATSAKASITVLCPPTIVTQPANQEAPLTANVTFTVGASGTLPMSYQWNLDGVPIPGAISSSYNIPNVGLGNYGNYSVLVTNLYGTTLSSNAYLRFASSCTPVPSGVLAWWPGENGAGDIIGTNNGIFTGTYTNGEVNKAFTVTSGSTAVHVPATATMNVGTNGGFTIEGWAMNYDSAARPVLEWGSQSTYGVHVWMNWPSSGTLYANVMDTSGVSHTLQSSSGLFGANAFQHVALTWDRSTATAKLYLNGNVVGTTSTASTTPQTSLDFYLGYRPYSSGTPFNGVIDEVSLYNRALAANEVQSVYFATSSGKCSSPPVGSLWVNLTSPTNVQSFIDPAPVPLQAAVYDNTGTNLTVKFYVHTTNSMTATLIGTATQATTNGAYYNLTWNNVHYGNYPITVQAVDNLGLSNSAVGVFTVLPTNNPPIVNITYPTSSSVFAAGSDITITATATNAPSGGTVTNVEFFVNDQPVGNDSRSPYSVTICCWKPGNYTLQAIASDTNGAAQISSRINITIAASVPASAGGFWDPTFALTNASGFISINALLGSGQNLYVAGYYNQSDLDSDGMLRWDGTNWYGMGVTHNGPILAIAQNGNTIYAGGTPISGAVQIPILQWDGNTTWTQLGTNGLVGANHIVKAIAAANSELYVGGDFTQSGTDTNAAYISRFNIFSNYWEHVGPVINGLNGPVNAIAYMNGHLYVGGSFTNVGSSSNASYIAMLTGNDWVPVGNGIGGTNSLGNPSQVYAMASCGTNLFVGGDFTSAGGNTTAQGIARWNGVNWAPIHAGLTANTNLGVYPWTNLIVKAISTRGDTIYVGGQFGGTQPTPKNLAYQIARATWNEQQQDWTWEPLDVGLYGGIDGNGLPQNGFVNATAIVNGSSSGSYDLYVGGTFNLSSFSQKPAFNIARWSVGRTYPTNIPTATVTSPIADKIFTNPPSSTITFTASAVPSSNVAVTYFVDGQQFQSYSSSGPTFPVTGPMPSAGSHLVSAVVNISGDGVLKSASTAVPFKVVNSGPQVQAKDDFFVVYANSPATALPVLANDSGTNIRISNVSMSLAVAYDIPSIGTAAISYDGTYLVFTPTPNYFGTNILGYSITNNLGQADQASVTVDVQAKPFVQITNPPGFTAFTNSASLTLSGTAVDYDGTITGVKIFTNGVQYGSTLSPNSSGVFSASWSQTNAGFYTFVATATDNDGNTSSSLPVTVEIMLVNTNANPPVAKITSPTPATTNIFSYVITNAYVVRNGQLSLSGSAYSPDPGAAVAWQVILVDPTNPTNTLYNVTPGVLNTQGFATNAVNAGVLGTNFDLSLVQNGTYMLTLVVQSEGLQNKASLLIQVESNLKIGQFSFSEQDLVLPVNGIPITITRTYNSINPLSSDFGYSWTFAINDMDVQLDEQRTSVVVGSAQALFAETEEDGNGAPEIASIRTGGSYDVTLTLPDGRRTTFGFSPFAGSLSASAQWTAPPGVFATLTNFPFTSGGIDYFPALMWHDSDPTWGPEPFYNHDVPGWMLQTQDGTQYIITRGNRNTITYNTDGAGTWRNILTYGPPKLARIVQRSGDVITISSSGISHSTTNNSTANRTVTFVRDGQNRITAIYDPNTATNGLPTIQYIYDNNTGNLIQVIKLIDRSLGTTSTNRYIYGNSAFPHYITEIDNGIGVPITRNFYDSSGRLTSSVDANGNTNQFIHNLTNSLEILVDPLGHTNTLAYDLRGNVTAVTNAVGGVKLSTYDGSNNKLSDILCTNGTPFATNLFGYDPNTGLLLAGTNALGFTNGFAYNSFGQLTTSIDALGNSTTSFYDPTTGNLLGTSDALRNPTTNFYNGNGLLFASIDALGTATTNSYDSSGNLTGTAAFSSTGTILMTNSFGYDPNGNRTNSTVWRKVGGTWTAALTAYVYDGQNRVVQTIDPDGGTNITVFDAAGRQQQVIDKLGRVTSYAYDFDGRLIQASYPDHTTETSAYDPAGNRTNTVDRAGRSTTYVFDALNRLTQTIFPDTTTNATVYDDLGRVKFSIDARGVTNAFGYDAAGRRVALTNAWGTSATMTSLYGFDANGNQVYFTNSLGRITTNIFDALNRQVQVLCPDGTKVSTGFDAVGRRVAVTNQDGIISRFGYDGLSRLLSATNGFSATQTQWAQFQYDEAGNETAQVDALNRTNLFAYDGLGRRITHTMPGGQSESFNYDLVGNVTNYTSFNGAVITNQYDSMNRLTNRTSINGYKASFVYSATGKRTSITDASGTTGYTYDNRDRLTNKAVAWTSGPTISLNYRFDANGNLTNLWSSSSGGVTNFYQFDALNRLTNVLANGSQAAGYGFDGVGNLQSIRYGNGVTNQFQYDVLNRLTNAVWKTNAGTIASFYYQLGAAGNRTNLSEAVNGTTRTYAWTYDTLYRLKQETLGSGSSGTLAYSFDLVGNRTNRTVTGSLSLTNQSFTFNTNDWLTSDAFDNNGNTTNSSGNSYLFDALNHMTNANNGAVLIWYDGDGNRMKKTVGSTTTYYLLDDQNPSGYVQVLEEWTGTTTLSRVYNYGLQLISQRQPNTSTNYCVFDGHGSTRVLTDNGGNVVNAFAFDAFGNLIASNAAPQTAYLFAGQQWDSDLGFYYNRARIYNQGIGRFTTLDVFEGKQEVPLSLHKYLYCSANPVNRVDPLGLADYTLTISYAGSHDWDSRFGLTDPQSWADFGVSLWHEVKGDFTGTEIVVEAVKPNDNLFTRVSRAVQARHLTSGTDRIVKLVIVGHGASGGQLGGLYQGQSDITLPSLTDKKPTPQKQMMAFLQPFTHDAATVYLQACFQGTPGGGQEMMKEMAKQLGPNVSVIGWDSYYALWGWGNEWTATWDGKSSPTITQTAPGVPYHGISGIIDQIIFEPVY